MSSATAGGGGASAIAPHQIFKGHTDFVLGVIHLPDGQRMITCSNDGSLRVWNLKSGKQIGEDWRDGESAVWTIGLSPDGKKVVSGSADGAVKLWDIDTRKVIAKWTGHTGGVNYVYWSQDGRRVVSGSYDGTARQWDVENGETILKPIETGHGHVVTAVYSPDSTLIATGGWHDSSVKIWNAETNELVATLKGHTSWVNCLAWTPDRKTLISGSSDNSIRTWNTTTWWQIAILGEHTSFVYDIAISPNGRILASASLDETARLWNLNNGQPISLPLQHEDGVPHVSFSADGKILATGCHDENAYSWDVAAILREAGLDDLLKDGNKALLNDDATPRPVKRRQDARRVPPGFFDDPPHRARFSPRRRSSAESAPHGHTLLGRISSLFSRTHSDAHDSRSRPRPLDWAINLFSEMQHGSNDAGIELHERRSAVVDTPYAQGKRRNASAAEQRNKKLKNATAGNSRPPKPTVTQQSIGAAQAQSSSHPHATVSTSPTTPAPASTPEATAPTAPRPDVIIRHAGRWTRFWLFICCCTSLEYTEGRH